MDTEHIVEIAPYGSNDSEIIDSVGHTIPQRDPRIPRRFAAHLAVTVVGRSRQECAERADNATKMIDVMLEHTELHGENGVEEILALLKGTKNGN